MLLEELQTTLQREGLAAAVSFCCEAVARTPDCADTHRYLGQLLAGTGDFAQALPAATRACELAPRDPRCFSDLGRVFAAQRRFREAAQCCEQALALDPAHADAWHNLGTALKHVGDRQSAFAAYRKALQIDPGRADTYLNLGNLLIAADQFEDAVECFERAGRHDPNMAAARHRLAHELSLKGDVKASEGLFRLSIALDPERIESWFGLGRTLEELGEEDGALGCYLNVLARNPAHAAAASHYLALVPGEPRRDIVTTAQSSLEDPNTPAERKALLGYGLLKFYHRRKDHSRVAAIGRNANAARRSTAGALDRAALSARVDNIIATCTRDFFLARRTFGVSSDQPIFIVGLPRSGTTLTEQILAAHPQLYGAGELPDLARIASRCIAAGQDTWFAATKLDEQQSREKAADYLEALSRGAPPGAVRISDKSPLNFFQLAFAALLFPNARVVHCVRNVRDNALSIWMENFNPDQRYATDFDDLAFYTAQYRRLMAHWREHLPLPILEVVYEDTVADLEQQARRLVDFLGVPWDARCLDFHRSGRAVQTPSRWQVRQPIYAHAVERWRAYAAYLPELESAFAAYELG